jgi:precorrin-6B methylase 2
MRKIFKRIITPVISNETVWNLVDKTLLKAAQFTQLERKKFEKEIKNKVQDGIISQEVQKVFPDLTVKHGLFAGMKYPEMESVGSVLFPKLLGSYEKELEPILEKICGTEYTEIVDIGCAEGYYAVGLAMKIPTAQIYAYDTNQQAITLCEKMAELNGVADRVWIGAFCDTEILMRIPYTKKALIISDCEGYEKELFTNEVARSLKGHDLLIEIHDFMDITISESIRKCFEKTHRIDVIESIDDLKKVRMYDFQELEGYDLETKWDLLAEHRPHIMEWFFIQAQESARQN